ncbi:MAG: FkbM family methyltransferase [Brevundimonas sp.]|nr:FkbM family methyltransferase [Brevundimonas sp.]
MQVGLTSFLKRTPSARTALAGPIALRRWWLRYRAVPAQAMLGNLESMVVSDIEVRVAEFEGVFRLGPRSHLLQRVLAEGVYEPMLAKLFVQHLRPDRDVIDVGANIGFFSVLAGKKLGKGRVLAAEPTRAAFARLSHNVAANGVTDKVILFNGLVTDSDAEQPLNIVPGREEYASLGQVVHASVVDQPTEVQWTPSRTLDSLVAEHGLSPALIKVDVEGAELAVLEGAEETLKRHRPVVLSEFSSHLLAANGASVDRLLALFERWNYDVRDPHDPLVKPGSIKSEEIIAVPRS